jgi:Arylsulfotransferase (ASST)
MTSCVANWLTRTFRCSLDHSNRGPRVRGLRCAPPRLEALEGRDLLSGASGVWNFVSAPQLHPMKVNVLGLQPGASLNPIFVAPYDQSTNPSELVGDTGPLIMDASGNPIWFDPLSHRNTEQAIGFEAQTLFGRPVLTWWQGTISGIKASKLPTGTSLPGGKFVIYNEHYREIMSVQAPKGFSMDEHEFLITPQGDAYFIATKVVKANLTPYGGPRDGAYVDPEVFEVNLRTKKLIFSWNMAAHVPLSDSIVPVTTTPGRAWDPYHANSIDVSPDGSQILVSARNTWGIYDISRDTGQFLWQLGGKQDQFSLPSDLITGPYNSAFQYQHTAEFVPGGISLFDDGGLGAPPDGGPYGPGRGLILDLDLQDMSASLASPPIYHAPALYPNSQGDLQVLGNGDVFIGWGSDTQSNGELSSYYTEYSSTGSVLADYVLAGQDVTYRALSLPWVGLPLKKPAAVAVGGADGQATVYASWNGSTQTVAWELLAGTTRTSLSPVSVTSRTGFETALATTAAGPFYQVKAIGAGGAVLDTSAVIRAHS